MRTILVTGGAGFIGSNFVHYWIEHDPDWRIVVFDKLTYAGNLDNLRDLQGHNNFVFVQGDICDADAVARVFEEHSPTIVVNFAAETHVDRSLLEPGSFIMTDVYGPHVLLEVARQYGIDKFVQVSSDEVYGTIAEGTASEDSPLQPSNPYSASKAGGDLMALAYWRTHKLPVIVTRGSNTYGPYQYPEKFIPLLITNAIDDLPLPIYGDGMQVRDWLFVRDHCSAIVTVIERGEPGEIYNMGAGCERHNIEVARLILKLLSKPESLIRYVADRPGHDRRYALNTTKIRSLGWRPQQPFEEALRTTVEWYTMNQWWWRKIRESSTFRDYYHRMYEQRRTFATPQEALAHVHVVEGA